MKGSRQEAKCVKCKKVTPAGHHMCNTCQNIQSSALQANQPGSLSHRSKNQGSSGQPKSKQKNVQNKNKESVAGPNESGSDKIKNSGSGWIKTNLEDKNSQCGTLVGSDKASSDSKGSRTKLKFEDFYPDSGDEIEDKKDVRQKDKSPSTVLASSSSKGASLEEALTGLKVKSKETDKSESNPMCKDVSRLSECTYCKKEGEMLKCSRCQLARYCNRECQKSDYPQHKHICRASQPTAASGKKSEEENKKTTDIDHDSSNWDLCSYCSKEGRVFKCSRCQLTNYCGKECQKNHYKNHKVICRRKEMFNSAISKVPELLRIATVAKLGRADVFDSLDYLPSEMEYRFGKRAVVILEITGPYPHLFRYGITVKDLFGELIHILFYAQTDIYNHVTSDLQTPVVPMPLAECLKPGNFIVLLNSHFHAFMDGTVGIRINDLSDVHFILEY